MTRHPRLVLVVALLSSVLALPLAGKLQDRLSAGNTISSSAQSTSVSEAIEHGAFPGAEVAPLAVVLKPRADARPDDLPVAIRRVGEQIAEVEGIRLKRPVGPHARASAQAPTRGMVVLPLDYGGGVGIDEAREVTSALGIENPEPGRSAGGRVDVHLVGEGALWAAFIERADRDTKAAEARAFPIIALVLLVAFGSLAATILPLVLGAIAVIVASAIIYLLSFATDMSIFAATVASMVGLGVAIDYSLFILVRYREEVRAGLEPDAARARAMATSGRAVVYSGLAVAVAQSALFLIASPGIRSIAAGTIVVVAVAVLTAWTVLPVLIAKLGRRVYEPGRLGRWIERRRQRRDHEPMFWARWTGIVMRRPLPCLLVAVALLLALAAPVLELNVRNSATSQLPADNQARVGMQLVADQAGPGALAPVLVTIGAAAGRPLDPAALRRVAETVRRDPGIRTVQEIRTAPSGGQALITAPLRAGSESQAAREAVDRLRSALPAVAGGGTVDVGGTTAIILDFDRLVTAELWRPILFVLAASFLVLLALLRSLVLSLKATLMNVLSILASYGALVGVFQFGWLEFLGIDKADTIYPITMPLVLTLCCGLSMDYHIFMLSRIQERYRATGDTRRAVAEALASSASPITSAALIMVVVFLAFVSAGAPSIQQLGFAAAVAIAVDATIVRLVIVPAAMQLLGDWNWWLPRPLERVFGPRTLAGVER